MQLHDIFEKVKLENARSHEKHGPWKDQPTAAQNIAIFNEMIEWHKAQNIGDIDGEHGEVVEAIHVINVMARRIMFLTGEENA